MQDQSTKQAPKLHDIVKVGDEGFKCFPPETVGWIQEVTCEGPKKKGLYKLLIIFRSPNLTGSNRHSVTVSFGEFHKHLQVTGTSPEFPIRTEFYGGW